MVNTGRMSVANAYPPSSWLPQGVVSVQNVAFDGSSVIRTLRDGTRFVAFGFGATDAAVVRAAAAVLGEMATFDDAQVTASEVIGPHHD